MGSFQDLLSCVGATVFFSLLVSFVVTKLLARDPTSMTQKDATACEQSKAKGESFIFDWICEEQSLSSDETRNGEMKNEAYDLVELLNPEEEEEISVADKVFDESPDSLGFCKVGVDKEEDEDWEGVERSELEKQFGDAMIFVGSMNNASNVASLDNDDKLQLYALRMVVLQGPYVLPQLVGLELSSRAKCRNALQQVRHMNREMAMDRYISLLTKNIPDWNRRKNTTNVGSTR